MKVLIVDDAWDNRVLMRGLLETQGYEVEDAANGIEALDRARAVPPELIVSDILMPEMDGFTLCRAMKGIESLSRIPFVFYTATYLEESDEALGMALGACRFLRKPQEPREFLRIVEEVVAECQGGQLPVAAPRNGDEAKLESLHQERLAQKLDKKIRDVDWLRRQQALILASAGEGILGLDRDGNHTIVNQTAIRLLGYEADELIGRHSHSLWHHTRADGSPYPEEECPIYACMRDARVCRRVEEVFWRKDGGCFPVEYSTSPLLEEGVNKGVVVVFRDITERKQAQQALRKSEARYRQMAELLPGAHYVAIPPGFETVYISQGIERLLGVSPTEVTREPAAFERMLHEDDRERVVSTLGEAIASDRDQFHIEYRMRHNDHGESRWISDQAHIQRDSQGKALRVFGYMTDITRQRELEEIVRRTQKLEAIGQLSGGIAHDFNNLLAIIIGNLDFLQTEVGDDPLARKRVETASRAAQRGARLTRRLLTFSRSRPVNAVTTDLNTLIRDMDELIVHSVTPQVEVESVLADDLWPTHIDPGAFEDALLNLVINARDAMPEGGLLTITTANRSLEPDDVAHVTQVAKGDYVRVSIRDTGTGMSEEVLKHIFEPFYTTKPAGKGTGLGLSLVYGFVQTAGGHVDLHTEVGLGTTICLCLPRESAGDEAVSATTRREPESPVQ